MLICKKNFNENPIIIGIESSCDDTGISVAKGRIILSNIVLSQKIHKKYGGVVPELAARHHEKNLPLAFKKAIKKAKINMNYIHAISFTLGPGLIGSLLVGTAFARSLSLGLGVPLLKINHIQAHLLVHFIKNSNMNNLYPKFPFLGLVISGGHTQIIEVNDYFQMKILGSSLDESVGNTFDKIAKMLGFYYPGGPMIELFAKGGDKKKFTFVKPLVKGLNFSFSGLISNISQYIKKELKKDSLFIKRNIHDLCASIQKIIAEILLEKVHKATLSTKIFRVVLSGGVSSNNEIRRTFTSFSKKYCCWRLFLPKKEYTTDNGAMIAIAGVIKYEKRLFDSDLDIKNYLPFSKFKKF
ncbi:tRNA (adenosine(37)-N6)-threonylcarbamoyltransferase complex transferase subunit TsaD [Blattabacterium cuenoti]|uniref:tRNA (adenosine(37)-N6)-threonylcarbamoyltransferase complex transferase subunit TsaD n=1 Tax=Blattabacterium cuenoti TaxID=1653831 RepID=UPI00163C33EC|nr:tRNA (adenosine(37)-N6)-threonylcarbamoyltransferase complex transferase subunit TsaD [Blattabacterium cuenoti]